MTARKIGVLGAGVMGHGIAQVAAQSGFVVVLVDIKMSLVESGLEKVKKFLVEGVKRGKIVQGDVENDRRKSALWPQAGQCTAGRKPPVRHRLAREMKRRKDFGVAYHLIERLSCIAGLLFDHPNAFFDQ